jgi:hypothetical protein
MRAANIHSTQSAQRNEISANAIFARHETFHPRFGWIKKGYDAVDADSELFLHEDPHISLGVGKNMGRSIRYWGSAFKVIDAAPAGEGRARVNTPSDFGRRLLADDGWDPWLEDPASLWLLHWYLLKTPCHATAWHFVFNEFRRAEFSSEDIFSELRRYRDNLGLKISDSSLEKDISCILRMYVEQSRKGQTGEETLDCPFVELGLIQRAGDSAHYAFRSGAKSNLPSAVIVSAALEYVAAADPAQRTVSISRLAYGSESPGLAFKLTESAICQAIEEVGKKSGTVALTDSAGLMQMSFNERPDKLALKILKRHYAR